MSFSGRPYDQDGRPYSQEGRPYSQDGRPYSQDGRPYNPDNNRSRQYDQFSGQSYNQLHGQSYDHDNHQHHHNHPPHPPHLPLRPTNHVTPPTVSPPSRLPSVSPSTSNSNSSPYPCPGLEGYCERRDGEPFEARPPQSYPLRHTYEVPKWKPSKRAQYQLLGPGVSICDGDEGVIPQAVFLDEQPFGNGVGDEKLDEENTKQPEHEPQLEPRDPPENQFARPGGQVGVAVSGCPLDWTGALDGSELLEQVSEAVRTASKVAARAQPARKLPKGVVEKVFPASESPQFPQSQRPQLERLPQLLQRPQSLHHPHHPQHPQHQHYHHHVLQHHHHQHLHHQHPHPHHQQLMLHPPQHPQYPPPHLLVLHPPHPPHLQLPPPYEHNYTTLPPSQHHHHHQIPPHHQHHFKPPPPPPRPISPDASIAAPPETQYGCVVKGPFTHGGWFGLATAANPPTPFETPVLKLESSHSRSGSHSDPQVDPYRPS